MLRYCLLVTGPAYGTQQASSALLFAQALIAQGHCLDSVFFYREGVLNASKLTSSANDEFDLTHAWQRLGATHQVALNVCVAAALRRGITDNEQAKLLNLPASNLQPGFSLSGLGELAQSVLTCDRVVQF
ncbi:MAG: sulfurtransferase complex subunit TusD [Candidatus Malihini olakiniferum]